MQLLLLPLLSSPPLVTSSLHLLLFALHSRQHISVSLPGISSRFFSSPRLSLSVLLLTLFISHPPSPRQDLHPPPLSLPLTAFTLYSPFHSLFLAPLSLRTLSSPRSFTSPHRSSSSSSPSSFSLPSRSPSHTPPLPHLPHLRRLMCCCADKR